MTSAGSSMISSRSSLLTASPIIASASRLWLGAYGQLLSLSRVRDVPNLLRRKAPETGGEPHLAGPREASEPCQNRMARHLWIRRESHRNIADARSEHRGPQPSEHRGRFLGTSRTGLGSKLLILLSKAER